ncbi:MAG: GtrA family protein [Chromatiales bacterium]|jgi:putative flippase GtrA
MTRPHIRFGKFFIAGGIGFVVDGGLLAILVYLFSLGPLPARCLSFPTALTVTWWINRNFAFHDKKSLNKLHEWSRYAIANGFGALVNFGIYAGLIQYGYGLLALPLAAFTIASAIAMLINFSLNNSAVFRG